MNVKSKAALSTLGVVVGSILVATVLGYGIWAYPQYFGFAMIAGVTVYIIKIVYDSFVWKYEREQK
jgi:ABC-type proline/glycine betaine transport system permease subunit